MYKQTGNQAVDPEAVAKRLRAMTKIRKLLRLAEDQGGTPEGNAALGRAESMMATYGLQRSSLQLQGDDGQEFKHRQFEMGRSEAWRRTLVHAIADYFDCVALYEKDSDAVETYGAQSALPQVEYTYVVYLRQLQLAWKEEAQRLMDEAVWGHLNKRGKLEAREQFCVSYVLGVKDRLERDRQQESREDPMGSRVSHEHRKSLNRWMKKAGVRWRANPKGVSSFSSEGYKAGLESEVNPGMSRSRRRRLAGGADIS